MSAIITSVTNYRASLPALVGQAPLASLPLDEPVSATIRSTHKTGLTPTDKFRYTDPHQRTFDKLPQGIETYQGLILTSFYYTGQGAATELFVLDPIQMVGGHVALVREDLTPSPGHAGGIAIIGDYLYVADNPPRGLHVYDLREVYPVAGNPVTSQLTHFIPRIGFIAITTPDDVGLAYLSVSGDGNYFITGNFWVPNTSYSTGGKSMIFKIPIDLTADEFPAAQPGVPCELIEPILRSGPNAGISVQKIQGAAITDTNVLIMSCSFGAGHYQLLVHDLDRETEFYSGNTVDPKTHDWKNWMYGCEDLCLTADGRVGTVTEFYDWRDITFWSLQDIVGLMGTYLPPTIAEHQAALAVKQQELQELQDAVNFYDFQITSAIAEGLIRFDEFTYLVQ